MQITTKLFGNIEIDKNKVVIFETGLIGLNEYKKFMIINDQDSKESKVMWLQSIDEPSLALPIVSPLSILEDYNPMVEDELFDSLGEIDDGEMLVFVTLTVPREVEKATVNLKAPLVINPKTLKGCQIVVENDNYQVKHPIYSVINNKEKMEGE